MVERNQVVAGGNPWSLDRSLDLGSHRPDWMEANGESCCPSKLTNPVTQLKPIPFEENWFQRGSGKVKQKSDSYEFLVCTILTEGGYTLTTLIMLQIF